MLADVRAKELSQTLATCPTAELHLLKKSGQVLPGAGASTQLGPAVPGPFNPAGSRYAASMMRITCVGKLPANLQKRILD